jgi:hypothetical protein
MDKATLSKGRGDRSAFIEIGRKLYRSFGSKFHSAFLAKNTFDTETPGKNAAEQFLYGSPLNLGCAGPQKDRDLEAAVEGRNEIRSLSRPSPSFHDDPDGAGLFGRLDAEAIPQTPPFVITAANLRQVGYRSYLTRSGNFFTDEALIDEAETKEFLSRLSCEDAFLNEETGLRPIEQAGGFAFDAGDRQVEQIDCEAVSLCSFEPSNYGAFLFRVLPKLAGRAAAFRHRNVVAPLYFQSFRDLFAMAGIETDRLIPHETRKIYQYRRVIIPSLRSPHALLDEETLQFYASMRDRHGTRGGARKVFVTRRGWTGSYAANHRVMLNEERLANELAAAGFQSIAPHNMSAKQQIEAFSSADLVVGASGSAMFNVVFCHPGTRLIGIESEPNWIFSHLNLFGSCKLDFGVIEAKAQDKDWSKAHKPFTVNIDAVLARAKEL